MYVIIDIYIDFVSREPSRITRLCLVHFRSFLNKSQPYSLALELYHFLLDIFRQKLWHHQEFVLTLLKSIE